MKFEKKHWMMLIIGALILLAVYWFFFRKKKTQSSYSGSELESNFKAPIQATKMATQGVTVQRVTGKCPCGSGDGTCFKSSNDATATCKDVIIHIPQSMVAVESGMADKESDYVTSSEAFRKACRKAGGTPGQCWNGSAWVNCCASATASAHKAA